MVLVPPAEPSEINAFNTSARLTLSQTQNEHTDSTYTQPIYSNLASDNQITNSLPQNDNMHPYDQSTVILQQFSMIPQKLKNLMDKVSSDITKIMQASTAARVNAGKLIENAILQALSRPQDIMPHNPTLDSRTYGPNFTSNSSYGTNWTSSSQRNKCGIPQQCNKDVYHSQRSYEMPIPPYAYVSQQPPPT